MVIAARKMGKRQSASPRLELQQGLATPPNENRLGSNVAKPEECTVSPPMAKFVVHQHHHYGWTKNVHITASFEEAARADIYKYHPWLKDYGHTISFTNGDYEVKYNGEPYPPAYHNTPAWASMDDHWFGERLHQGAIDDCDKCGGTGVNHYYSWRQCWACGDKDKDGKSSGKQKVAA
jgi:hypothetical protein